MDMGYEESGDEEIDYLLRSFTTDGDKQPAEETNDEAPPTYKRIMAQLQRCKIASTTSHWSPDMAITEFDNYETLVKMLQTGLQVDKDNMSKINADLAEARNALKNATELDVAIVLNEYRTKTLEQVQMLKAVHNNMAATKQELEGQLTFDEHARVLMSTITQLQTLLEEPEESESESD